MANVDGDSMLAPESYTAHRLDHASHSHIHLTTRRTFIGPIPEGWLKAHRKQWWRKYSGLGNLRAPTFTAAPSSPSLDSHGIAIGAPSVELISDEMQDPSRPSNIEGHTTSTTSLLPHGQPRVLYSVTGTGRNHSSKRHTTTADIVQSSGARIRFQDPTKRQLQARAQRLLGQGSTLNNNFEEGEILKVDRMLLRSDVTQQSVGSEFDEKISLGIDTERRDKWRQFIIVCRKHTESGSGSVLQFYQTRVLSAGSSGSGKAKKRPKLEILLKSDVGVNLYSSLDKTLCLWQRGQATTTIYYLKPQSSATSVEWYTFLRSMLGWKRTDSLHINVPVLNVSLRLDDPFNSSTVNRVLADAVNGDDEALIKALNDEKGAAGAIVHRCVDMLQATPEWAELIRAWVQTNRIGLAWKRYDRLEWVHGATEASMYGTIAMTKTHDLELRPKDHYPTSAKDSEGRQIGEPEPVEGFLIRLTSQKGQERRMGNKRLYFTTQNHYLLFLAPARAVPPRPPRIRSNASDLIPSARELVTDVPLAFKIDPYPLSQDRIKWLAEEDFISDSERQKCDWEAEAEAGRNGRMLLDCDGFINLCDVSLVRNWTEGRDIATRGVETPANDGNGVGTTKSQRDRTFELVMENGLVVRLQSHNKEATLEWIRSLGALVEYWRQRVRTDLNILKSVRQQNLETLRIDERQEALMGSFAYKWEVGQSFASSELYNMCGISQCRTIHLSGLLFRKPRKHTTFTRCHVILAHGHLMVFQDTLRSRSGRQLMHVHHERVAAISLAESYLYSGLLTEDDLLYQNRTFDSNTPGHHALPRMFAEDGWTSTDEDAMTTFVIWHAKSKSWFKSSQTVDDVRLQETTNQHVHKRTVKTKLTRVSQLGTTGRSVLFKARSRVERDRWVTAIQIEIERLVSERPKGDGVRIKDD